jgi:uncharacterized protein (TIGR02145 family)
LAKTIEVIGGSVKIFTNVIASPVRAKQSIFGRLVFALVFACIFIACGDESGSSAPAPDPADGSSSSVALSSRSSSSVKPGDDSQKSSSSSGKTNGSSSSEGGENSSSSENDARSSSSGYVLRDSLCSSDYEGWTQYIPQLQQEFICENGRWIPMSSSSVTPSSSSKYYDMSLLFVSENDYSYGEFTDPRDGQVYKTLRFEFGFGDVDSITIFAQNLNYGKMIPGGTQMTDSTKFCYDDDPWYCDNGFGGLYTWATVMNFPAACDSFAMGSVECPDTIDLTRNQIPLLSNSLSYVLHQGICPDGWHVMSQGEWAVAMRYSGSRDGASYLGAVLWGSNQRGFSLLPAGKLHSDGPHSYYINMDKSAYHWLPGEYKNEENGYVGGLVAYVTYDHLTRGAGEEKFYGLSIRCTKDY